MAKISDSVCLNHPDTPAVTRCATCGKPVCKNCIVNKNGSNYCSQVCADNAQKSAGRVSEVMESRKRADSRRGVRTLVILIILIAAGAAAYYFYTKNKEFLIRQTIQNVYTCEDQTECRRDQKIH